MLQQRFFTKVYPTCLMYSVRALCWLCRHKSYLLLWVISGKTSQCLLGEVKCQFLSETLSERASWFVLLAQRLSSACLSWISSPLKNTHKTCIFCTCILAPSRRQTRSSRIIFWPSWNPGYIQQKCTSCWQTFFNFFFIPGQFPACKQEVNQPPRRYWLHYKAARQFDIHSAATQALNRRSCDSTLLTCLPVSHRRGAANTGGLRTFFSHHALWLSCLFLPVPLRILPSGCGLYRNSMVRHWRWVIYSVSWAAKESSSFSSSSLSLSLRRHRPWACERSASVWESFSCVRPLYILFTLQLQLLIHLCRGLMWPQRSPDVDLIVWKMYF